ncbi:putative alpha-1,2-mannosidase [Allocatelliglobosispora scoriae]|uniref:Putative alpha-1,2-mannosidase n=1 Tax=Allocatelliglobosispora scoriae TaxID=643052 RepID=A0A841BND0_9ACTN|nr:GH92 family glycosyl hydrolase [Allocatelliglobosispora scoriae]MBB5868463.1 putative alpha-1,2-mannosidase [Allocatelliglobosispora scoriae]
MSRSLRVVLGFAVTASMVVVGVPGSPAQAAVPADLTTLVNPLIGTQKEGNTFPGAALPFGMVQVSPDTGHGTGYNYDRPKIWGFSQTHLSGVGCASGTDIPLMPTIGAVNSSDPNSYGQALNHAQEQASAGFYRVAMPNGVTTELTATLRTGWQRHTFPASTQANILFNTAEVKGDNGNAVSSSISIVNSDTVEGSVTSSGFCNTSPAHTVYFSAKFSRAFASFGTWSGGTFTGGSRTSSGTGATGGWVRFDTSTDRVVTVKLGLSYTGLAGARNNLTSETSAAGFNFDTVRNAARDTWNAKLHKAEVDGGTADRQVAFYTSLYHSLLHPNLAGDVDGSYRGFDNVVRTASGYTPYQTFSLWDTYRAQNQLVALLEPQVARDSALSLLAVDRELGWLPRWSMMNTETNTMTGDPVTPFLVDLWARGLLNGYEQQFYTALRKNALGTPPAATGLNARNGNPYYTTIGYLPTGVTCTPTASFDNDCQYPASATLEYAAADSALAIMARALGYTADADLLNARGQNYRNIFDPSIGFFRPRNANGTWAAPYAPTDGGHKFHEAGAYQYQWLVPQDPDGLVSLLGGKAAANTRLDQFFAYSDLLTNPSGTARDKWVNGAYDYYSFTTYNPNNEPDLLAPYTYLWTGQPAKTATVLRAAYTLFTNGPNGVTGNDDLGTMSAWYVFSSLGLYPLMNGANFYGVTTPQFPTAKVTIGAYGTQQGGTLNIAAPGVSDANRYIGTATLNGTGFTKTWLSQAEIAKGATLNYTVTGTAGSWGTGAGDTPPSSNHTTPPAAPVNLALNKPATGSAACAADEGPAKAVNGSVAGGNPDKFCSLAAPGWLQVDLGSTQQVNRFVVKHAGSGNEGATFNTRAFNIQLSTDGSTWTTPVTVTNNEVGATAHSIATTGARYVRLNTTTATQTTDTATRIYEFEVYGSGTAPSNLALNQPTTSSAPCGTTEGPEKAVNGSVSGGNSDKFCSGAAGAWLRVDLGSTRNIVRFEVAHAEAGGEQAAYNTRAYTIEVSNDGTTWSPAASVTANTAANTSHTVAVSGRYVRLTINTPTQTTDAAARIYELRVFG